MNGHTHELCRHFCQLLQCCDCSCSLSSREILVLYEIVDAFAHMSQTKRKIITYAQAHRRSQVSTILLYPIIFP